MKHRTTRKYKVCRVMRSRNRNWVWEWDAFPMSPSGEPIGEPSVLLCVFEGYALAETKPQAIRLVKLEKQIA